MKNGAAHLSDYTRERLYFARRHVGRVEAKASGPAGCARRHPPNMAGLDRGPQSAAEDVGMPGQMRSKHEGQKNPPLHFTDGSDIVSSESKEPRIPARELPELARGLDHGQRQFVLAWLTRLTHGLRPDEPRRQARKPFVQQRAHGVGRAAAERPAHALDDGLEPLGEQRVRGGINLKLRNIPFASWGRQ